MISSLIGLFFSVVLIYAQQRDEIVECRNIDLTPYQLDQMNFTSQEQLVNHLVRILLRSWTVCSFRRVEF